MKTIKTIVILLLAALVFSCSSKPSNKILKKDSVFVGWHMGQQQFETRYLIRPSYSQAFRYAFGAGYAFQLAGGIALWGLFFYIVYRKAVDRGIGEKKKEANPLVFWPTLLLIGAGGLALILMKPISIREDNHKWVPASQYEYCKQTFGDTQLIWDSLHTNNLILGAAK